MILFCRVFVFARKYSSLGYGSVVHLVSVISFCLETFLVLLQLIKTHIDGVIVNHRTTRV